jgi:hypothetical protein
MEKSEIQTEWDKIKESNLIKVKTLQKKYLDQLRMLKSDEYSNKRHVVIGWYYMESFDYVLIKDVTSSDIYKMAIWSYSVAHCESTGAPYSTTEEQVAMDKMIRTTFDQIFI